MSDTKQVCCYHVSGLTPAGTNDKYSLYSSIEAGDLKWSNAKSIPSIGAAVNVVMNKIGHGTVAGYFAEHGFLGVWVIPSNPPKWLVEQNARLRNEIRQGTKQNFGANSLHLKGWCGVFGSEIDY